MTQTPGASEFTALACVRDAIPAGERSAHAALIKALFRSPATEPKELETGMSFDFEAKAIEAIARFIANERRCCPFLRFDLLVPSGEDRKTLTITGPEGTRPFLALEILGAPSE